MLIFVKSLIEGTSSELKVGRTTTIKKIKEKILKKKKRSQLINKD